MQEDPFPDQTILATVYESTAKMKGPYPGWDKDMHFVVSTDFFKTKPRNIVPCGNQFEVRVGPSLVSLPSLLYAAACDWDARTAMNSPVVSCSPAVILLGSQIINDQIYLAAPSDCPLYADGSKRKGAGSSGGGRARTVSLLVSEDEGLSFSEACVPMKWLDKGYNLFETHGGDGAFLIVSDISCDLCCVGAVFAMPSCCHSALWKSLTHKSPTQVDHDETDEFEAKAPISVIYNPGPNSTIYSLGMRRNYRRGYVTDFARVEGLPGTQLLAVKWTALVVLLVTRHIQVHRALSSSLPVLLVDPTGMYLANQLDGKIFRDPSLLPAKGSYSQFVQTKARALVCLLLVITCQPGQTLPSRALPCTANRRRDVSLLSVDLLQWRGGLGGADSARACDVPRVLDLPPFGQLQVAPARALLLALRCRWAALWNIM